MGVVKTVTGVKKNDMKKTVKDSNLKKRLVRFQHYKVTLYGGRHFTIFVRTSRTGKTQYGQFEVGPWIDDISIRNQPGKGKLSFIKVASRNFGPRRLYFINSFTCDLQGVRNGNHKKGNG
jgi:hypothetical protein